MKFAKHTGRRRHIAGSMNGLERAYSERLEVLKSAGEIIGFDFEAVKLKLAKSCFYTPDFIVYRVDGVVEIHEVKGHWEDDARVKIKVATEKFPFVFIGVTRKRGEWITEEFKPS